MKHLDKQLHTACKWTKKLGITYAGWLILPSMGSGSKCYPVIEELASFTIKRDIFKQFLMWKFVVGLQNVFEPYNEGNTAY